jgi:hypothetical protein
VNGYLVAFDFSRFENLKIVECIRSKFEKLEERQAQLIALNENKVKSDHSTGDYKAGFLAEANKNPYRECKRIFLNLWDSLNDLGLFALDETVNRFKPVNFSDENIVIVNDSSKDEFLKLTGSLENYLRDLVAKGNLTFNEENCSRLMTKKVQKLISVLIELNLNSRQFHAIIFVEKRETAYFLDYLLKKLASISKFSDKLSFIKSNYIVGHEADQKIKMTMDDQVFEEAVS